jgi:hypothetical protein
LLIVGTLVTLSFLGLNYFNVIQLNYQLVFAPILITGLLVYGNRFLIYVLIKLSNLFAKLFLKGET